MSQAPLAERVAKTRAKKTKDGLCSSCMKRKAGGTPAKDLCKVCYKAHINYLRERYDERRAKGLCVQCGEPAGGAYLCEPHAEARAARRAKSGR